MGPRTISSSSTISVAAVTWPLAVDSPEGDLEKRRSPVRFLCAPPGAANQTIIPVTRTTRNEVHPTTEKGNKQRKSSLSNQLRLYLHGSPATLQLILFIFALLFVSHFGCATATPVPSVAGPGSSSKQQQGLAEKDSASSSPGSGGATSSKSPTVELQHGLLGTGTGAATGEITQQVLVVGSKPASNTAEKLKRGLTNFMNQLNPAPFFVPAVQQTQHQSAKQHQQQQQQQQLTGEGGQQTKGGDKMGSPNLSSSEPATIVSSDSSLVIKGSANRWAFARPIGGPLRWGRR